MPKAIFPITICASISLCCQLACNAQRSGDPNLGHFYMGRQQVQIIDDSPMISPGSIGTAGSGKMNGALPNRPMALPKAGWQTYTPMESPGSTTSLPKVN